MAPTRTRNCADIARSSIGHAEAENCLRSDPLVPAFGLSTVDEDAELIVES